MSSGGKLPVPTPRLFSSNKNSIRMSEQNCFVVRATSPSWSNPVFMQTTEKWTCYAMKATVFTDYEAAEAAIEELRSRPPLHPTGASLFKSRPVIEAVPLMGQIHRNRDTSLRKK